MKRHKIRARILEALTQVEIGFNKLPEVEKQGSHWEVEVSLAVVDIAKRVGYPENEVESQITYLEHQNELQYINDGPEAGWYMLTAKGRVAYADDKYVTLSSDEILGYWGKRVAIFATSGTLIISSLALYNAWSSSSANSAEFIKINQRIDSLNANLKMIFENNK